MLSEAFGEDEVTLIDKSDAFYFGFSKLDVMFGRTTPDAVRCLTGNHKARRAVSSGDDLRDRSHRQARDDRRGDA